MTREDVLAIRDEVRRLNLDGADEVVWMPADRLATAYNGTGPEFLPAKWRSKLDDHLAAFLPAVMVHDVDFEHSDGTAYTFGYANRRLLRNCLRCANAAAPWHCLRRYRLYIEAYLLYRACRDFGWIAWRLAYQKNPKTGKELNA